MTDVLPGRGSHISAGDAATGLPPAESRSILDRFRAATDAAPDRPAVLSKGQIFTYTEIDRWSDAIASKIVAGDTSSERPVAILVRGNIPLVPAVIGVVKAGRFFLILDARDPEGRIESIIRDAGVSLCLVESDIPIPAALQRMSMVTIGNGPGEAAGMPPPMPPHPNLCLMYTSGTTGRPKAIMIEMAAFLRRSARASKRGFGPDQRLLFTSLPGFARAPATILNALVSGSTLCAFDARSENPKALADWIRMNRIRSLSLPPALFRRLIAAGADEKTFASVERLELGADRVTLDDVATFKRLFPRGAKLRHVFAATELGGGAIGIEIDHDTEIEGLLVPLGTVVDGVDVRLIREDGSEAGVDEVGEIVVTSSNVIDGYWNDPELSARRFSKDPHDPGRTTFRTGDMARRDARGLFYFVGREDGRLKIHGRRIDPIEVEAAILSTGLVRDAVVVGKGNPESQKLVAYVVVDPGAGFVERDLRVALRRLVPQWMIPSRIVEIGEVPFAGGGKVDRRSLTARADPIEHVESGARDEMEQKLVDAWSRAVEQPVHVDEDFFDDLGGDSITAAHLVTEVEQVTGRSLPLSLLLELNTITKMAEYLRVRIPRSELVVEVQRGGSLPPLFCVSGGGGSVISFRALAALIDPERPVFGLQHHGFEASSFPTSFGAMAACFCDAIREVQPNGPYHLAGYSMGGQIAYEIARQLEKSGETVAFLGLIDTAASSSRLGLWTRLMQRVEMLRRDPRKRSIAYLREAKRLPSKVIRRLLDDAAIRGGREMPRRLRDVGVAYTTARDGFQLRPYGGVVTLFCARGGMQRISREKDLGWSGVKTGGLHLVQVDGDHNTVLNGDVASLAAAFRTALDDVASSSAANSASG